MATIAWFSAGAASAVATALTIPNAEDLRIVYIDTRSEHEDNARFLGDCAAWFDRPIERVGSTEYYDVDDVIERRRYIAGTAGAPCSLYLKKRVRQAIEDPDDVQVFGYTADRPDVRRADRFRAQNPDVILSTPLIERGLTKSDCLAILHRAGIAPPLTYDLGFPNANCLGCVKANSFSYWNLVRCHFPEVFERRARQESDIGYSICKDAAGPVWLDELDPDRGDASPVDWECSLLCGLAESELPPITPQPKEKQ